MPARKAVWSSSVLKASSRPCSAWRPQSAATDQSVSLQLRLEVPADADIASKTLTVKADGPGNNLSLPITINLAKELPAKLTLSPQLPALRGTPKSSFDYTVSVKNDSGRNLTVSLAATAPRNFETSFTESYGTQELSSVPIDAGASKDVKLKVRPPSSVDAGSFPIEMTASSGDTTARTQLTLDVVGQPRLTIAGSDEAAVVESVKAASEVFAPVSGEVLEVNADLEGDPATVNRDAEGEGWFMKIRLSDPSELDSLMDGASYRAIGSALFDADEISQKVWKTHDLRDRTIRLVRFGLGMMRDGYRRLLRFPYRNRN